MKPPAPPTRAPVAALPMIPRPVRAPSPAPDAAPMAAPRPALLEQPVVATAVVTRTAAARALILRMGGAPSGWSRHPILDRMALVSPTAYRSAKLMRQHETSI